MTEVTVEQTCMLCGKQSHVTVDKARFEEWERGRQLRLPSATHSVQAIFPDLSPGQRETLISGSHESCFDRTFGSADERLPRVAE